MPLIFIVNYKYKMFKNKNYVITTYWSYPFGGGEEFMHQTMMWTKKLGMNNYWISFAKPDNTKYEKLIIEDLSGYISIKIPGGYNDIVLYNWLKILKPYIVHHQGHFRENFYLACDQLKIPFLTGIHFWTGCILLNEKYSNIDILKNKKYHNPDPELLKLYDKKYFNIYTVSKYVHECILEICKLNIQYSIFSGSSKKKNFVPNNIPANNMYVTMINIHELKGGELLLYLLNELPDIPFLVIKTEYMSEDTDKKIYELISNRKNSIFMNRENNIKFVYANTRIFLAPSLVDETFCRTVNEAMMNGIPVITSGRGNLKYLVQDDLIINPDQKELWRDKIKEYYYDNDKLHKISEETLIKYNEYSENVCQNMFINVINDVLVKSRENNIMILTPWCDQGLGIQSKNYYNILKTEKNITVSIFSYCPYNAKSCIELQKDPNEWLVDNLYYSQNDREHIKDIEIINFINNFNIGKCIIPETCWFRIFEIANLLNNNNVKCYAIPNIEIVRKDEFFKHDVFEKIICNNLLCKNIFNKYNINKTEYIGYGLTGIEMKPKNIVDATRFLFIGGMNAFSRKQILQTCESFTKAYDINNNITLTCTIQKTNDLEINDVNLINKYFDHPAIKFIQSHLKYSDIIDLYYNHDVTIQVSKHEGLGIGFYESLYTGTPVITLNTPPHNEIIIDNVNGWLVECSYKKMTDNPNSFIESAYFEMDNLTNKILFVSDKNNYTKVMLQIKHDLMTRLNFNDFSKKFINSIA
jgi:glycosyltransferase involved in cell wall biosynthesis